MRAGYVLSVTQLNDYVSSLIGNDALLRDIAIRGEISGFKRHSSGHLYFSLKDEKSLVRCVMFRQNAMSLDMRPADGMSVTAHGYASLFTRDGQFQFYVRSMEREGEGELYGRFLALKERLDAMGLFDVSHKRELPRLPRAIGVVTSRTGAVFQDILNVTRRRFPSMNVTLCPARVQGEGAAEDIARGIRQLDESGACDVMIVGRGGGSMEDLWAFNEEAVAMAIYSCSIPVVSAVGHETDFTIADFTADLRAPTPSAAAELCVPEYEAECAMLGELEDKLSRRVHTALQNEKARLDSLEKRAALSSPKNLIAARRSALTAAEAAMTAACGAGLMGEKARLDTLTAKLDSLSPERTLERGYALVKTPRGAAGSIGELERGERAELIMHGGEAEITIDDIRRK